VSEAEVRDLLGLSQPAEGERVLGAAQPGGPSDALANLLSGGSQPAEGVAPEPGAPAQFRRRSLA